MARRRGTGLEFVEALPEDGERRLMLAVLIDAVRALKSDPTEAPPQIRVHRELVRDRVWMLADDRVQLFSFLNICDALGLNADYIRRCVLRQTGKRPSRLRRYAAKAEESWLRQRKDRGMILPTPGYQSPGALPRQAVAAF